MSVLSPLSTSSTDLCVFIVGLSGIVWYCAWEMIVHDSPTTHPTISHIERNFIESSIAGSEDKVEVSLLCVIFAESALIHQKSYPKKSALI